MYLKLLSCEIMVREVCYVVARAPHICDVAFLDQGFHDRVDEGRASLQAAIDSAVGRGYDAIGLGYGLCNNLIAGLEARDVPLVVPRAHDCITIFLGSRAEYDRQFAALPGTYYYTSGWLECRTRRGGEFMDQTGGVSSATFEQYVRQYGEDNAKFLVEALGAWTQHYERGALITYSFDQVAELERRVRAICTDRGWRYEELHGDIGLLERWVGGEWDEREFLIVPPGRTLKAVWDGRVVAAG